MGIQIQANAIPGCRNSANHGPATKKMKGAGPNGAGFFIFATEAGFGSAWEAGSLAAAATRERRDKRQEQPEGIAHGMPSDCFEAARLSSVRTYFGIRGPV